MSGVRLQWQNLREPKEFDNGNRRFEATLIIEPDSDADKTLTSAMKEAAAARWGEDGAAIFKALTVKERVCRKDGNKQITKKGEARPEFADMVFFTPYRAAKKGRPIVMNEFAERADDENWNEFPKEGEGHLPRDGDYVKAQINVWAQDNPEGGQRLNAELEILMHERDGDSLEYQGEIDSSIADDFVAEMGAKERPAETGGLRG